MMYEVIEIVKDEVSADFQSPTAKNDSIINQKKTYSEKIDSNKNHNLMADKSFKMQD